MSSIHPTPAAPIIPDSKHRETTIDFVRWALAQLELETSETNGILQVRLPETDQATFAGQTELRLPSNLATSDDTCEPLDWNSRFGKWLLQRLQSLGPAAHVRPVGQPIAVNDITQRLFAAYQVQDGQVHLGGCQLTDYPFLRLSFASQESGSQKKQSGAKDPGEIRHLFVAYDGSSVSEQLARDLGLLDIEPIVKFPPRLDDTALQALLTAGRRTATQSSTSRDPSATAVEPVVACLVWVKHASGKLHFTIGDATVDLPFSGWARLITAQPYTSPLSGSSSFQLAATDDGRIDTADQIIACQQSGRRVLGQELVTCHVTGKQVLEEFTELCPVSGQPCLAETFATCDTCQQKVSQSALDAETCLACQQLVKINKDDPRLVWILGEHGGLDRWNRWQLAETQSVYITIASSWTKRLLAVVDKESLAVQHLATASRVSSIWTTVDEPARAEFLS